MSPSKNSTLKVGIDTVEISRFVFVLKKKKDVFIHTVFSLGEIEYCSRYKDKAPHFAGLFAAKEAVSKALGATRYPFTEVEIRHTKDGAPIAYHKNKKISVAISITHTNKIATAIAIA